MDMSASGTSAGGSRPVPRRLLELVATLRAQYGAATSAQEELLCAALDEGRDTVDDLVYVVPSGAAQASAQLEKVYDEADEYSREGSHLLTLSTPDDLVAFRRWFLGEFVRQAEGHAPTPWPEHPASS
jgi:hypothetical protein